MSESDSEILDVESDSENETDNEARRDDGTSETEISEPNYIDVNIKDHSRIIQTLLSHLQQGKHSDVVIKIGDSLQFQAHKLILSMNSDVFESLLTHNWKEGNQNEIQLDEIPICEAYFKDFLQFVYSGEIIVTCGNALPLLFLADKYNVQSLLKYCSQFVEKNFLPSIMDGKLMYWMENLRGTTHEDLYRKCKEFSAQNFTKICSGKSLGNIKQDVLIELLSSSDLVVESEEVVFRLSEKWLMDVNEGMLKNGDQYQKLVKTIMDCVRFQMMSPYGVGEVLRSDLCGKFGAYFLEKLRMSAIDQASSNLTKNVVLRNYLGSNWGEKLEIQLYKDSHSSYSSGYRYHGDVQLYRGQFNTFSQPLYCLNKTSWTVTVFKGVKSKTFKKNKPNQGVYMINHNLLTLCLMPIDNLSELYCTVTVIFYKYINGEEYVGKVVSRPHLFRSNEKWSWENICENENFADYCQPSKNKLMLSIIIKPLPRDEK